MNPGSNVILHNSIFILGGRWSEIIVWEHLLHQDLIMCTSDPLNLPADGLVHVDRPVCGLLRVWTLPSHEIQDGWKTSCQSALSASAHLLPSSSPPFHVLCFPSCSPAAAPPGQVSLGLSPTQLTFTHSRPPPRFTRWISEVTFLEQQTQTLNLRENRVLQKFLKHQRKKSKSSTTGGGQVEEYTQRQHG